MITPRWQFRSKLVLAIVATASVALTACRGCHGTAAKPGLADAGTAQAAQVGATLPPPAKWERKVAKKPPLGKQINAAQILIASQRTLAPWAPATAKKRTLEEARRLAGEIAAQARAGADFSELAIKYSDWPFAKMKGTPGYGGGLGILTEASVGQSPEAFKAALSLKVGEVSEPIDSQFGVHVFKRLPAPRVSEILLTYEGIGRFHAPRTKAEAIELARKIEDELGATKSFGDEAFAYSDDVASAGRDGDMGAVIPSSKVSPEVQQAIPRLSVGQVSPPLETSAGLVIVKRTE